MNNSPSHIAIIMDGNGRWAQSKGHSRFVGHVKGAKVVKNMIQYCSDHKTVRNLTLFAFSTENWFRPTEEVSFLMKLLCRQLDKERRNLNLNNVKFRCIGDTSRLPKPVQQAILKSVETTVQNTGLELTFAISYSGRQDLTFAMQELAQRVSDGKLSPEDINEDLIQSALPSCFLPDPDLIIRTSGECRLSNFFLWQSAYSEIYISGKMWPEFKPKDLEQAISSYSGRSRRFGRTQEQIKNKEIASPVLSNDNRIF